MSLYVKHSMGDYPPRIVCFVCGTEGPADYPLYTSPHGLSLETVRPLPHFPFLQQLAPPLGCQAPDPSNAAHSCRSCYSSLMRQWDDNERGGVAVENRVYCHKRTGGLPVLSPEQQLAVNRTQTSSLPVRASFHLPSSSHGGSLAPKVPSSPAVSWKEMGPPITSSLGPTPAHSQDTDNDSGALDLSSGSRDRENMKSRSSVLSHMSAVSHHSSYVSEGGGSSTDILDLTFPDKNALTEVCYVCGDEHKKGSLAYLNTRQNSGKTPHYPSLVHHPRPPRSRPMDSAGRVQTCEDCRFFLYAQWEQFDQEKCPHTDRNYVLRKRQTPVVDTTTFVCYICALDYHSSSLRLLYCRSNGESEPYYPQVEQPRPPPGASPISSGGMVQVCSHCYKCTRDKYQGFLSTGHEPPPKKRKSSRASAVQENIADFDQPEEDGKTSPADVECPLCQRKFTVHSFKFLHSQGPPLGGIPYFPFLKLLSRPLEESGFLADEDSQGRVRACQTCNNSLINQWTSYQREAAPIEDRTYSYQSLVGPQSSGRVSPGQDTPALSRATATPTSGRSLHSPVGGSTNPPTPSKSVELRAASTIAGQLQLDTAPSRPRSNTLESRPRSNSNPHSPRVGQPPTCHSPISVHSAASTDPAHKPSTSSFYCFLCGFHSELSFARMLYSHAQGKKAPYFPFMKDHVPKPRAEMLREDGTALVCTFCYHSVMVQWSQYQDVRSPLVPASRKYNINDYVCYVCTIKTYRKRIRALRVVNLKCAKESAAGASKQDFPFLRNHKQAKGTITMENGDMAAVCLDCFETLKNQFVEQATKYGIPVEKRQYNWMQIPPPPEDQASLIITRKERLEKHIISVGSEAQDGGVLALPDPSTGPTPAQGASGRRDLPSTATSVSVTPADLQLRPPSSLSQTRPPSSPHTRAPSSSPHPRASPQAPAPQPRLFQPSPRPAPGQASYAAALRDLAHAQGEGLLPQGFGEAIAASMFSQSSLPRAAPHYSPAPLLPMARLPALPALSYPSPFHPSPYASYDPNIYRFGPTPLSQASLALPLPTLSYPAPPRHPASGNAPAPPSSSSLAPTREGRYPSG